MKPSRMVMLWSLVLGLGLAGCSDDNAGPVAVADEPLPSWIVGKVNLREFESVGDLRQLITDVEAVIDIANRRVIEAATIDLPGLQPNHVLVTPVP